jgi:hypothetical protein
MPDPLWRIRHSYVLHNQEEKWFTSGESNVFHLYRRSDNGSISIILIPVHFVSEKDFES